jgi:hypothetical protein
MTMESPTLTAARLYTVPVHHPLMKLSGGACEPEVRYVLTVDHPVHGLQYRAHPDMKRSWYHRVEAGKVIIFDSFCEVLRAKIALTRWAMIVGSSLDYYHTAKIETLSLNNYSPDA